MELIIGYGIIIALTSYGVYKVLHICRSYNLEELECGNKYFHIKFKCKDESKEKKE